MLGIMQDPLEVFNRVTTCPFCQTKFSGVVKLIPECGEFICGICHDHLKDGESKEYNCKACDQVHVLPENGLPDCKRFADLLRHPVQKPLSKQAKKLKNLIEDVQEEMANLEAFDPKDHIEDHCVQLELEVSQAAESAVERIHKIEQDLLNQIRAYRQQCLNGLAAQQPPEASSEKVPEGPFIQRTNMNLSALKSQILHFSARWNDYFNKLNSFRSDNNLESAIRQIGLFQDRMRILEQEMKNRALGESLLQFNPNTSFQYDQDNFGQLEEISTQAESTDQSKFPRGNV